MDTFILFIATVIAWFALEFARVFTGRITISEQVRNLSKLWPSVGFLTALIAGLLMGHFFINPGVPLMQVAGLAAGLLFGLVGGAVWFR